MEPLIIASSFLEVRAAARGGGMAHKQRSPAGARWADREIHRIEKMRHCESLIVGGEADWVKPGDGVS
jgi:hypothetical protein